MARLVDHGLSRLPLNPESISHVIGSSATRASRSVPFTMVNSPPTISLPRRLTLRAYTARSKLGVHEEIHSVVFRSNAARYGWGIDAESSSS